ncbi:MAG: ribonuclease J [Rhodospirillaceae bacterium]|jgi:ribonuclease J|nr:ribonuclease J [Rhodospirillaceae bacterium]MBT6403207.1 ribonuclease J [Rhodospirillaceae bacterium]MBT6536357.1 ribonuclease J [Rhodospirillaceae bacterium]MBT7362379.1 ribonuclease J [Rhodospirillaceae bacterium]
MIPGSDEVLFVPLGGTGEIGMNFNLYGHDGAWMIVDCGVTFGDPSYPGVDVMTADPKFIEDRRDKLAGMLITHAHEDHVGAVAHLWPRLKCPVYATPFTLAVLRRKLEEAGLAGKVPLHEISLSGDVSIGPFDLTLVTLTHSIPEPNGLIIKTGVGTIFHTGDWKLDPDPLVGDTTDEAALRAVGDAGVLAMIGDSTNATVEGEAGSEAEVRDSLLELVGNFKERVAFACFASNIARVQTVAEVAHAHGRAVGLVGRSLWRMTEAARATGYLRDLPPFVREDEAMLLPRDKVALICTGSQGEPRAALSRIARDDHQNITLDSGDTVIFSSRIIPGNEVSIGRLQNQLTAMGVDVITEKDHFVHVSGHPARGELRQMYQWIRPTIAVPVHGEAHHLRAHAELARECQVPHVPIIENGDVLRLHPDGPEISGQVQAGRLAVDGRDLIRLDDSNLRERNHMLWNGSATLTIVIDRKGRVVTEPQLSAQGVLGDTDEDFDLMDDVIDDVLDALSSAKANARRDDEALSEHLRRAVRKSFRARRGKNPSTEVHLVRLDD